MRLFYAPDIDFAAPHYRFAADESRHIARVLRLGVGDALWLTDGRGTLARAEVTASSDRECEVTILESKPEFERRPYRLVLGVAPTKNADRYEWMAEKATEIGVDAIVPVLCDHSERRTQRTDRLEKIVVSAMKQSLKAYLPVVEPLCAFDELVARPFEGLKLIAHCEADTPRELMRDVVAPGKNVLLLIGPEGDFSPEEIALALSRGFRPVSLGSSRLRTETAAIAGAHTVALINES